MAGTTSVDRLHGEAAAIVEKLQATEPSLAVAAGDSLRKGLLLAAASHFEKSLSETVLEYVGERSPGDPKVVELVRRKAVHRQYHTWFDWDQTNANQFFAMFGRRFKDEMSAKVKADGALTESIRAFLRLGQLRNQLVHEDYASHYLDLTLEEIHGLYQGALPFVESFGAHLREPIPPEPT